MKKTKSTSMKWDFQVCHSTPGDPDFAKEQQMRRGKKPLCPSLFIQVPPVEVQFFFPHFLSQYTLRPGESLHCPTSNGEVLLRLLLFLFWL